MRKNIIKLALVPFLFIACASGPEYVQETPNNKAAAPVSLGIDDVDLQNTATSMINSMLASPVFALENNNNERYVLAIGRIINDTMQHFDTDILVKKIRIALLNSGRVYVTTAIGANGVEDEMNFATRDLRSNDEFDQSTIAQKGTLLSANRSLTGKIIQRNTKINSTFSSKQRVDYYIQMSVTDLKTGLALWEDEVKVQKTGSSKSVAW